MQPGDYVRLPYKNNTHGILKILRIDAHERMGETFHCRTFRAVSEIPERSSIGELETLGQSVPISGESIRRDGTVLFNEPVTAAEMDGFHTYLKYADFHRYVQESGVNLDDLVSKANALYRDGCRFAENGEHRQAIEAFDDAVDIFPIFHEAIDNRGFSKMDMGDVDGALADFKHSISVNPQNPVAYGSCAECYVKKGDLHAAEQILADGCEQLPDDIKLKAFLSAIRKSGKGSKPWWRLW